MKLCKKCNKNLASWSKFDDMVMKEGVLYAIFASVFNGFVHMVMGNSSYRKGSDCWSNELYYCTRCKIYYIKCPNCGEMMPLSVMPKNGKTIVECKECEKKILYATDYNMGGG